MKKIIFGLVCLVALAAVVFSGYTLFTKSRDHYIRLGQNVMFTAIFDQAKNNRQVTLQLDGETTTLVAAPQPEAPK